MTEITDDKKEQIRDNLEFQLALQRANEEVTSHYREREQKLKSLHNHEIQNLTDAQITYIKPKLWHRITGRYKDIYILMNGKIPMICPADGCKVRFAGVNNGFEAIALDIETALEMAEDYFENCSEYGGYSFHSLKILHIQLDRRSTRRGVVVRNISLDRKKWREEKEKTRADLEKITANKLVIDSLMSMRPKRRG